MTKTYFARMDCTFLNFHHDPKVGAEFTCYRLDNEEGKLNIHEVITSKVTEVFSTKDGCDIVKTESGSTYIVDVNRVFLDRHCLGYVARIPKVGKPIKVREILYRGTRSECINKKGSTINVKLVDQVTENCYKIETEGGNSFYVIRQSLK